MKEKPIRGKGCEASENSTFEKLKNVRAART